MGDVKDLTKERKKRSKEEKATPTELAYQIVQKMNREMLAPKKWPPFPRRFHTICDKSGRETVLEETDGKVVTYQHPDVVTKAILQYCYSSLGALPGADMTPRQAVSCRDLWLALTPPLKQVPVVLAEKSEDVMTFNRLSFDAPVYDPLPDEVPPRFGEFLARCTQKSALCAFLGSLFFPQSDRQQYLYLYGAGQDGKGALIRMLYRLLGDGCQATEPKEKGDRFWNMKAFGKRLLLFTDCGTPEYFVSPGFKALTGDDPIYFEEKGKMGFTAVPTCKVLVASNLKPTISSQTSDLRRLIYVEVTPFNSEALVAKYEDLLIEEAEPIIRLCKTMYLGMCPEHGPIPAAVALDASSEAEEAFTEVFLKHFVSNPSARLPAHEVRDILRSAGIVHDNQIRRLKEVWSRAFSIRYERKEHHRFYCGMTHRLSSGIDLANQPKHQPHYQDDNHDNHK